MSNINVSGTFKRHTHERTQLSQLPRT